MTTVLSVAAGMAYPYNLRPEFQDTSNATGLPMLQTLGKCLGENGSASANGTRCQLLPMNQQ
jgi:hypothetical protein